MPNNASDHDDMSSGPVLNSGECEGPPLAVGDVVVHDLWQGRWLVVELPGDWTVRCRAYDDDAREEVKSKTGSNSPLFGRNYVTIDAVEHMRGARRRS